MSVTQPDSDLAIRSTAAEATSNLATVLQLVSGGTLRCSEKTRKPAARTVSAVADVLVDGDFYPDHPIASFAWPLLLQAGGLAHLAGGRLRLTERGRTALGRPAGPTIRQLWRRWLTLAPIDELSRIDVIKGQRSRSALSAVKPRRRAVADALALCPREEFLLVDDLFADMREHDLSPTIARNGMSLWKLYIADQQYGSLGYSGYHEWEILEGRYTLCVLFEYAATLGLIDIVYKDPEDARSDFRDQWGAEDLDFLNRYDGLSAVRLNPLGAYVLGLADAYEAPKAAGSAERSLKVLANFEIVATSELATADRAMLDAYTSRSSDHVWTMSTASLTDAVDRGHPLSDFRRFLVGHATHELPETVTTLIGDVDVRMAALRDLGVCRVIECADAPLAALIAHDQKLRSVVNAVGDRHIAVPVEHEAAVRKRLRAIGYVIPATSG